jgi:hypothetical protein
VALVAVAAIQTPVEQALLVKETMQAQLVRAHLRVVAAAAAALALSVQVELMLSEAAAAMALLLSIALFMLVAAVVELVLRM